MKHFLRHILTFVTKLLPSGAPEFIYTVLAKPKSLRRLVNACLTFIIPDRLTLPEGALALDKKDPIVSGAITLGVYEWFETRVFRKTLKPGMVVVDVGAHIGYYTLIAARRVAPGGKVFAFEPEAENFALLERTLALNHFPHVACHDVALADVSGRGSLFLSPENSGDHRLYDPGDGRARQDVRLTTLDRFAREESLERVDLVKMDIQGAEGRALRGMCEVIAKSAGLTLFTEFWPEGLWSSGVDPRVFLASLRNLGFTIFEISERERRLLAVEDFDSFIRNYPDRHYTNLYCRKTGARVIPRPCTLS